VAACAALLLVAAVGYSSGAQGRGAVLQHERAKGYHSLQKGAGAGLTGGGGDGDSSGGGIALRDMGADGAGGVGSLNLWGAEAAGAGAGRGKGEYGKEEYSPESSHFVGV
jgi:hypothetical protein